MGGRDVCGEVSSHQPYGHHGSQQHSDRRRYGRRDAARASGRQVPRVQLARYRDRRTQHNAVHSGLRRSQIHPRKADDDTRAHDAGEGRSLDRERLSLARRAARQGPDRQKPRRQEERNVLARTRGKQTMINPEAKLVANIFEKPDMASTREGFGKGVVEAGKADERVVVLTADLAESTNAHHFQKAFPERFVQMGVAEQNLATVAAGMANYGKVPFITSYAAFNPGRNWEQIRTTIALNDVPVVVNGMHAGVSLGPDGATHQAL